MYVPGTTFQELSHFTCITVKCNPRWRQIRLSIRLPAPGVQPSWLRRRREDHGRPSRIEEIREVPLICRLRISLSGQSDRHHSFRFFSLFITFSFSLSSGCFLHRLRKPREKRLAQHQFFRNYFVGESRPICLISRWKRGSPRSGSKRASTLSHPNMSSRSS